MSLVKNGSFAFASLALAKLNSLSDDWVLFNSLLSLRFVGIPRRWGQTQDYGYPESFITGHNRFDLVDDLVSRCMTPQMGYRSDRLIPGTP
jgi:hypothetical protein